MNCQILTLVHYAVNQLKEVKMTKEYTVQEVLDLQTTKAQLEQRLEVHRQRAEEKKVELTKLLQESGVSSIDELTSLCASLNQQMQQYANNEALVVEQMRQKCDELDKML